MLDYRDIIANTTCSVRSGREIARDYRSKQNGSQHVPQQKFEECELPELPSSKGESLNYGIHELVYGRTPGSIGRE